MQGLSIGLLLLRTQVLPVAAESIVLDRRLEESCLLLAAIHVGLVSRFGPPRREDKVPSCCSNTTQVDPVPAPGDQWMGKKKKLVNFAAALATLGTESSGGDGHRMGVGGE